MQETNAMISVGFGREPIMPDTVLPLGGNGLFGREYTGVNDTLYITCVALTDAGGSTVLIYTMDTLKSESFIHPLQAAMDSNHSHLDNVSRSTLNRRVNSVALCERANSGVMR